MATHPSILAWRITWTKEPGGLQSMGLQRVGHNWATNTHSSFIYPNKIFINTCSFDICLCFKKWSKYGTSRSKVIYHHRLQSYKENTDIWNHNAKLKVETAMRSGCRYFGWWGGPAKSFQLVRAENGNVQPCFVKKESLPGCWWSWYDVWVLELKNETRMWRVEISVPGEINSVSQDTKVGTL